MIYSWSHHGLRGPQVGNTDYDSTILRGWHTMLSVCRSAGKLQEAPKDHVGEENSRKIM